MQNINEIAVLQFMGSVGKLGKGGSEALFLDLVKYTHANSYYKYQFAYYKNSAKAEELSKYDNVTRIYSKNKIDLIRKLRKVIQSKKIRIVHVHGYLHVIYVYLATIGIKCKVLFTVHGLKDEKNYFSKKIKKTALCLADKVLFVSESFGRRLINQLEIRPKEKFKVLYNGIDENKIPQGKRKKPKKGNFRCGMTGNFHNDVRDQLTICKAVQLIKKSESTLYLDFAGGASKENDHYYRECQEYVNSNNLSDQINFLGFRNDALDLLHKWDIFVYSSNRDTFGVAVVEAMMSGVPVFVNNLDVFEEITENGKYATLYRTKDPDDLAEKIINFIDNPEPYLEKAKNAAIYAREKFSIEKHFQNLDQIYNSLLADET